MAANWLKPNKDKTELLWVRIRHSLCQQGCCLPVLQLNSDIIAACDNVCLLGVTFSSDLSLDWHVFIVSVSCFHWLRQLQSFDIHWQWNLRLHSSIHSQCHTSITVMLSWRMRRKPERSGSCQRHFLQTRKSFLFAVYWYVQRIKGFMTMHYINQCLFIYLPVSIMAIGVVPRASSTQMSKLCTAPLTSQALAGSAESIRWPSWYFQGWAQLVTLILYWHLKIFTCQIFITDILWHYLWPTSSCNSLHFIVHATILILCSKHLKLIASLYNHWVSFYSQPLT